MALLRLRRSVQALGSRRKQTRQSLQICPGLTSTSVCAGTFCGELERGPVSGKTTPLELMVLMLEVREFQVLRGVVEKVRIQFIDGL